MKLLYILIGLIITVVIAAAAWVMVRRKVSREGFQQPKVGGMVVPPPVVSTPSQPSIETCTLLKSIRDRVQTNYNNGKASGMTDEQIGHLQTTLDSMAAEITKQNCPM
jgi:hypothetical protein